jgi:Phycobilisome protein
MLSQMERLSFDVEGRYASDDELRFIPELLKTYELRVQTYQKLQELEQTVIQQVYEKMLAQDANILRSGNVDLAPKWKRDTIRVWRYSAAAVLINDSETFRDRFLLWFQTVMRAFNAQKSCYVTYTTMQEVVKLHLTHQQSSLFLPILDLNRSLLGNVQ